MLKLSMCSIQMNLPNLFANEQLNVTGVPFFVFEQKYALSGAQPREVFLQALQQAEKIQADTHAAQCDDQQCDIPPSSAQ